MNKRQRSLLGISGDVPPVVHSGTSLLVTWTNHFPNEDDRLSFVTEQVGHNTTRISPLWCAVNDGEGQAATPNPVMVTLPAAVSDVKPWKGEKEKVLEIRVTEFPPDGLRTGIPGSGSSDFATFRASWFGGLSCMHVFRLPQRIMTLLAQRSRPWRTSYAELDRAVKGEEELFYLVTYCHLPFSSWQKNRRAVAIVQMPSLIVVEDTLVDVGGATRQLAWMSRLDVISAPGKAVTHISGITITSDIDDERMARCTFSVETTEKVGLVEMSGLTII